MKKDKIIHYDPSLVVSGKDTIRYHFLVACGCDKLSKGLFSSSPDYSTNKSIVTCEKCKRTKLFRVEQE